MSAPQLDDEVGRARRNADRPVLGLLLIGLGLLWFLEQTRLLALSAETILSSALILVALGLVFTARNGTRRWPIILGGVLTLILVANSSSLDLPNVRNVGEQNFRPVSGSEVQSAYRGGFGNLTIDLRRVPPGQLDQRTITINQGFGRVAVSLPANLAVHVEGRLAGGQLVACGAHLSSGLGINEKYDNHPAHPAGHLTLVIRKGFGDVEVLGCQSDGSLPPGDTPPAGTPTPPTAPAPPGVSAA